MSLYKVIFTSHYRPFLMCFQGLNTKHSLYQKENSLPFLTTPQPPKQLSERSSVLNPFSFTDNQAAHMTSCLPQTSTQPLNFQFANTRSCLHASLSLLSGYRAKLPDSSVPGLIIQDSLDIGGSCPSVDLSGGNRIEEGKIIWSALQPSSSTWKYYNRILTEKTLIRFVLLWLDFKFRKINQNGNYFLLRDYTLKYFK